MSAWDLPITVQVAGRVFAIRSDFRAVLDALAALADPDLTQQEQYIACLQILYPRWKELPDANAALRAAFTFINEGKEDEQQGFRPRLVDWEQDAALIAPAVDKVLGYSCRRCGYLHWWEFLGAFHGIGDGLFAPDDQITREQIVTILYRFAKFRGLDVGDTTDLAKKFTDAARVSDYAKEALSWAVAVGIINGMPDNTIAPQNSATRAEVATIIMRFIRTAAGK